MDCYAKHINMNEIISQREIKYVTRRITHKIREIVEQFPVLVLAGARQVGKSTLLMHEFPDFSYCTLDDFAVREQANIDPQSLWSGTDRLIIDEAQNLTPKQMKTLITRAGPGTKIICMGNLAQIDTPYLTGPI